MRVLPPYRGRTTCLREKEIMVEKLISVEKYNEWSRRYSISKDDGDDLPGGRDQYVDKQTGELLPFNRVASDVMAYYRKVDPSLIKVGKIVTNPGYPDAWYSFSVYRFPDYQSCRYQDKIGGYFFSCSEDHNQSWFLRISELRDMMSRQLWKKFSNTLSSGFVIHDHSISYFLAAYFSRQNADKTKAFLSFARNTALPLSDIVAMERAAKTRGNEELGRQLHLIFESRKPEIKFRKIDEVDAWGDPIWLEKGSVSEQSWQMAQAKLGRVEERKKFAKALGYFTSVKIDPGLNRDVLQRFSLTIHALHGRGLPTPPHLEILERKNERFDGLYKSGTITLFNGWTDWNVYTHELGHFAMDLLEDENGTSYIAPVRQNGQPLFNRNSCNQYESISGYGGKCDQQRTNGDTKEKEDPAETFAWVVGITLLGREYQSHAPFTSLKSLRYYIELYRSDVPQKGLTEKERADIQENAAHVGKGLSQKPPIYCGDDLQYLQSLDRWLRDNMKQAGKIRDEKIQWMMGAVQSLIPQDKRANPVGQSDYFGIDRPLY